MKNRRRTGTGTPRPWRVFVRDIGPTFSFANEADARARALALTQGQVTIGKRLYGPYSRVEVSGPCPREVYGWERTVYRYDKPSFVEVWSRTEHGAGWVRQSYPQPVDK